MSEELAIEKMAMDPEAVLIEAQRAAAALQRVVASKKKPVILKGEQYLEFEDWQTIAKFYGLCVNTLDAQPIEVFGVNGAKARAEVIDLRTGQVVGGAEAYCMKDEINWQDKPWFQLASMAQTRAGAKALRNLLAWVAVLAGYKPTPAEEMVENATKMPLPELSQSEIKSEMKDLITEPQRKKIFVLAKQLNIPDDQVESMADSFFGKLHISDLTKPEASKLIEALIQMVREKENEQGPS